MNWELRKRRRLLCESVAVIGLFAAFVNPAAAADPALKAPPASPASSWTGFYIGSHVGTIGSSNTWNDGDPVTPDPAFTGEGVIGGAIYGGQIGYNYQVGRHVIGLEADVSTGKIVGIARCATGQFACTTEADWLATVAARFGWTVDDLLLYGKAGAALTRNERVMWPGAVDDGASGSETRVGWLIGAGLELALNAAFSAKLEYNYIDFGDDHLALASLSGAPADVEVSQSAHVVKLGLNYHLGENPLTGGLGRVPAPPPQWSWDGFYVGAHIGGAFGRNDWTSATGLLDQLSSNGGFPGRGNAEGLLGGGQVGFNYQLGSWVAGLELSVSAADIGGYAKCASDAVGGTNFECSDSISSLGTITGRLGQTWGNLLLYGKAGAAWATSHSRAQRHDLLNVFEADDTRWGWVVGSGVEYALSRNMSAFVAYDHFEFGDHTLAHADQIGNVSNVGFRQRLDAVTMGFNYRLGAGAPDFGGATSAGPLKAPQLPSGWSVDVGSRYFVSSGRMQKDLYDPFDTQHLNSRLIYAEQTGHAVETFFRFDHQSGLFAKGYFGIGQLVDGNLNDEDFPASVVYSNTLSKMKEGGLTYGAADLGYNVFDDGVDKLGAFVGYRALYQRGNGFGCAQLANDTACAPAFPPQFIGLSETESWRGVAFGINTRTRIAPRTTLEVDAAYLPYVNRAGFDNHWFRTDINPQSEPGHGWGAQFEAVLSYAVTDRFSVGLGGRYWFFATDEAHTQFPGLAELSPMQLYAERYGGFLQASYRFGDRDRSVDLAEGEAPRAPVNWTGLYAGGTLGAGFGRTTYADPFPAPVSGDMADLGGAVLGGQVGANYQVGSFVIGAEAFAAWTQIEGTNTCFSEAPAGADAGFNCGSRIDAIGALTARAGYAFDRTLIYAKGGAAWDRHQDSFNTLGLPGGALLTHDSVNWGWTAGGGIEYALQPNWSIALEYRYFDFGKPDAFTDATFAFLDGVDLAPERERLQTVTLGVNYRFGPGGGAR